MKEKHSNCIICGKELVGRQKKFCSSKCRCIQTNKDNQTYIMQRARGWKRKLDLINKMGGACSVCGYNKNMTGLCFHHVDPSTKLFNLDARSLSNRIEEKLMAEAEKCILLCHNCHSEHHHPQHNFDQLP